MPRHAPPSRRPACGGFNIFHTRTHTRGHARGAMVYSICLYLGPLAAEGIHELHEQGRRLGVHPVSCGHHLEARLGEEALAGGPVLPLQHALALASDEERGHLRHGHLRLRESSQLVVAVEQGAQVDPPAALIGHEVLQQELPDERHAQGV
eukprot:scaffold42493_cov68-Phaeocystis_antarctica.AAC.5